MKKIIVTAPSKTYGIYFGRGALNSLPETVREIAPGSRAVLISDSNVFPIHGGKVSAMLGNAGIEHYRYIIPAGEQSKNPDTLFGFLEFMADNGIGRSDIVIALGGGVVGDLGGFAASIYQRGIRVVQIPTTLLAMADSSVGGKTAVDLKAGKNLAGTFWQPEAVICDPDLLSTLPENVFRDGCAEVIKYGIIYDGEMFARLEGGIGNCLDYAIERSICIKRDIVQDDERDRGVRGLLNFGHTLGHAVEKLSDFEISHGSAVAVGMVAACKIASKLGMCDITGRVDSILKGCGFDTRMPYRAKELSAAARSDKKRDSDKITLILPERIGKCVLRPMKLEEFDDLIKSSDL